MDIPTNDTDDTSAHMPRVGRGVTSGGPGKRAPGDDGLADDAEAHMPPMRRGLRTDAAPGRQGAPEESPDSATPDASEDAEAHAPWGSASRGRRDH